MTDMGTWGGELKIENSKVSKYSCQIMMWQRSGTQREYSAETTESQLQPARNDV